jgi:hypothetical protein
MGVELVDVRCGRRGISEFDSCAEKVGVEYSGCELNRRYFYVL